MRAFCGDSELWRACVNAHAHGLMPSNVVSANIVSKAEAAVPAAMVAAVCHVIGICADEGAAHDDRRLASMAK